MMQMKHWQDPVNAVLGVWLIASPWVLGFAGNSFALSNAVLVGIALMAAALGATFVPRAWEEWTEAGLGAWMMVSPWILGFNTLYVATVTAVATGAVILALALWALATDKDYGFLSDRAAH